MLFLEFLFQTAGSKRRKRSIDETIYRYLHIPELENKNHLSDESNYFPLSTQNFDSLPILEELYRRYSDKETLKSGDDNEKGEKVSDLKAREKRESAEKAVELAQIQSTAEPLCRCSLASVPCNDSVSILDSETGKFYYKISFVVEKGAKWDSQLSDPKSAAAEYLTNSRTSIFVLFY